MGNYQARTAIEIAIIASLIVTMTILIRPGQGGEDPGKVHRTLDCARCHAPVADIAESEVVPSSSDQCVSCHNRAGLKVDTRLPFHLSETRQCTDCHSFHHPDIISARSSQFHIRFAPIGRQAICGSCHNSEGSAASLSEGHRRAADLYHSDNQILTGLTPSEACLLCHSSPSSGVATSAISGPQPPAIDDLGHPTGTLVIPGSGREGNRIRVTVNSRIPLFNARIECQTCHSLNSNAQHLLVGGMSSTELCQSCHDVG